MTVSTPPWWSYVKHILMEYPNLCAELAERKKALITTIFDQHITARGKISRPVENLALRELSPQKQRKYNAVTKAIALTKKRYPTNGADRLKVIDLVYFTQTHSITGAAVEIPCHFNTAAHWQGDFIRLVAEILELP